MNVLVTGVNGQLGYDVVRELNKRNIKSVGIDRTTLDLTNEQDVYNYFSDKDFSAIIHCAAYTAVDKAQSEKETCYDVNVNATKYLTKVAREKNIKLMYISTDYVFDGTGTDFLEIDSKKRSLDDTTNYYGTSKLLGEYEVEKHDKHFIVRISWVFGSNGNNFINTMLNISKTSDVLSVINDQFGSPTYTIDLSKLLVQMIQSEKYGVYHASNEGVTNWNSFAKMIFKLTNRKVTVNEVSTSEYKTAASRPLNSRLSKKSLIENGFDLLPTWEDALERYLKEKGEL